MFQFLILLLSFDHNDQFGQEKPSFKSYFKDYDVDKTAMKFKAFTAEYLTSASEGEGEDGDQSSGDEGEIPKIHVSVRGGLDLTKGPGGVPQVPSHAVYPKDSSKIRTHLQWQKTLVRTVISEMYSKWGIQHSSELSHKSRTDLAAGRLSGSCPWKVILSNPSAFYDASIVFPNAGFTLSEPSRMQKDDLIALLSHWLLRQRKGLVPFFFTHVMRKGDVVGAKQLQLSENAFATLPNDPSGENEEDGADDEMSDDGMRPQRTRKAKTISGIGPQEEIPSLAGVIQWEEMENTLPVEQGSPNTANRTPPTAVGALADGSPDVVVGALHTAAYDSPNVANKTPITAIGAVHAAAHRSPNPAVGQLRTAKHGSPETVISELHDIAHARHNTENRTPATAVGKVQTTVDVPPDAAIDLMHTILHKSPNSADHGFSTSVKGSPKSVNGTLNIAASSTQLTSPAPPVPLVLGPHIDPTISHLTAQQLSGETGFVTNDLNSPGSFTSNAPVMIPAQMYQMLVRMMQSQDSGMPAVQPQPIPPITPCPTPKSANGPKSTSSGHPDSALNIDIPMPKKRGRPRKSAQHNPNEPETPAPRKKGKPNHVASINQPRPKPIPVPAQPLDLENITPYSGLITRKRAAAITVEQRA